MQQGYIKVYRGVMDKGWFRKPEYVAVWFYLLMRANYRPQEIMVDGKILKLKAGQFLTSRKQMASDTGVHESKIQRILSLFQNEQQIEQQTSSKNRIITIVNWQKYQTSEHHFEHQMNSKRTPNEQQMNTDNEFKKERKEEGKSRLAENCRKARTAIGRITLSDQEVAMVSSWGVYRDEEIDNACAITRERGGESVHYINAVLKGEKGKPTPSKQEPEDYSIYKRAIGK